MWVADHLHTVCDFHGPDCALSCNERSTWKTLHKKTICFTKQIKERFTSTEFFIKMDDDTFIDREYINGLIENFTGLKEPVYISDFILNLDYRNRNLNGSYYGNGKFYMFNRRLLDCIDPTIKYRGDRNEDAIFGGMTTLQNLNTSGSATYQQLAKKPAIIFPINKNTDMQFYRNTWLREYMYPVCDWSKPGCKIVCNRESTYKTLDEKTFCFSKEMKNFSDKEFFIKIDDDAFVDRDYVFELMRKYSGSEKPVYISHHTRYDDLENKDSLDNVFYGNGKFYMFNYNLVKCLNTDFKYEHRPRNEDAVFGGMVRSGCGEKNVEYVQENDAKIWHKKYKNKNKQINLAYIKNH
ncbi:hypothetical protein GGI17_005465 [Coemansia sp. S146]|nr:hypothetical protein GGI17_005465 [Coemansia sp. S146]